MNRRNTSQKKENPGILKSATPRREHNVEDSAYTNQYTGGRAVLK